MSPSTRTTPHKFPIRSLIIKTTSARFSDRDAQKVVKTLYAGGTAVFPTDTVYGLAANVFRPGAIQKIYELKGRSHKKPIPLLVAERRLAESLVEPLSPKLKKLLDDYWPGPLTVVFKTSSLGRWVTGGKDTVAIRIPKFFVTLKILKAARMPWAVTSANPSGDDPAVTGKDALALFKNKVDVLVDAGPCPGGEASTVLDASGFHWTLAREGAVSKKELERYMH